MSDKIIIHQCFEKCECDSNGESFYGLDDSRLIKESALTYELKKRVRWGSVSCSKCGQIAIIKDGR